MNIKEKIKIFKFRKKDINNGEKSETNDWKVEWKKEMTGVILERIDILAYLEESEMRLCGAIEELQRCYAEYKKAKSVMESSDRKIAELAERYQQLNQGGEQ